jgi:ATP phosphoribosyltransferase regulatory subunit
MHNWLLPEYIEDILPADALRVEGLRRQLLDLFHGYGYELVMPPLLEYMDSLLTGTGHEMELKTFKVVDQLSGKLMGLRADITPQVARIDAHLLNRQGVTRLCYAGSVLHTLPSGLMGTREPLQIGAEVYGHAGLESDIEVQQLMLKSLAVAGVADIHLDLGHVGIFRSLIQVGNIGPELELELFQALQAKDVPTVRELTTALDRQIAEALLLLPELYGEAGVLQRAERHLPPLPQIAGALADLRTLAAEVGNMVNSQCFDLADLRGYHYHSGTVFAAYSSGVANAIALGGRYDEVGKAFGRARPATGFSMDLRAIASALPPAQVPPRILAPACGMLEDDGQRSSLRDKIDALRMQGEAVVVDLPGHEGSRGELNYDRELVWQNGVWQVVART